MSNALVLYAVTLGQADQLDPDRLAQRAGYDPAVIEEAIKSLGYGGEHDALRQYRPDLHREVFQALVTALG